jgi:hypothetical protein
MFIRRVGLFVCFGVVAILFSLPMAEGQVPVGAAASQFRFQDNFWVNLHHFLRAEARRKARMNMNSAAPVMPVAALPEEQRKTWNAALDSYADLAKLSLIFDERLIRINSALAVVGDVERLSPGTVEPEVVATLNAAAPIYRAQLWDQHWRANEEWIAKFAPLVHKHAASTTKALAAAYQVPWPVEPILVDLSCEAGPNLAYTTDGPHGTAGHSVIAPLGASDVDDAFETVFHEASHTVDDKIMQMIDAEGARQHVNPPKELWHVMIFYTTGEIIKRELGKQGDPTYKPYAYRVNLYGAAGWDKMRVALERDWQPYLDGKVEMSKALHDLVRDAGSEAKMQ